MQLLQCSVFHNLLRTFTALQVLLDILLLTWGASEDYEIVVKTLNFGYSVWINSFFFFFVLFRSGHFHNVVQLDVENENVVSTWSDVVHVNVEIHNVDSTLLDVANFNVEIRNVVSTLIWRCPMLRRPINQKTTLKQCWNVFWVEVLEYLEEVISIEALKLKHHINRYIDVLVKLNFSFSKSF